jgi:hypothetical protein
MTEKEYSAIDDDFSFIPNPNSTILTISESVNADRPVLVYADASPPYADNDNTTHFSDQEPASSTRENNNQKIDIYSQIPEDQRHLVEPALIGGSVLGLLLGGPVLSIIIGCGSAYSIRKQDSVLGDIARGVADITQQVQTKAIDVETKHKLFQKFSSSIKDYCNDYPQESWINKTQTLTRNAWSSTVDYTRNHQLIERGVEGTGRGIEYLTKVFSSSSRPASTLQ